MSIDLCTVLAETWRPRIRAKCMDWVAANVWLDKRFTPREGFYDVAYTPYLRPLHDWFGDPAVRSISTPKGAQIGYTTFLANAMSYAVVEDPGPVLFATSTADNAKSWSEREWLPRIRDCKKLDALKPDDEDDMRKTEQHFLTCTVKLVGAQSENNLASRPIRYLFADEVDKWPSGFLGQAEARTIAFRGTDKILRGSTCTDEEGPIWMAWLRSSMHLWHVPCPECGQMQVLDFFKHIKWPEHHRDLLGKWDMESVRSSTFGQCEHCGARWEQRDQRSIVRRGEAVATNPKAGSADLGIHLPSLLSPTLSWGDLAVLFLQKKDEPGGLADFYNQYLALPFADYDTSVKDDAIYSLRGPYRVGSCPVEPALICLTADPGEKETHWAVHSLAPNGEMHLLDYGRVIAIPDLLGILKDRRYTDPTGKTHKIHTGIVDSAYQTEIVYRVCAFSPSEQRLYPSRGVDATGRPWNMNQVNGWPQLLLYVYSDFTLKSSFYIDRVQRKLPPLYHLPEDVGPEFIQGLSGQAVIKLRGKGRAFKKLPYDHYGDCAKLAVLCWWASAEAIALRYKIAVQGIPIDPAPPDITPALTETVP